MRIGFFDKPINDDVPHYKGLYRQNDLLEFFEGHSYQLSKMMKWFFGHSQDGTHIEYSDTNLTKTLQILNLLRNEKWYGELMLFSDAGAVSVPSGFELVGYDICADSKYYSPLGDGFLLSYNQNEKFFEAMSFDKYLQYSCDINDFGMFSSQIIATDFAKYCNWINSRYPHIVESEDNWRPYAIYLLQDRGQKEKTGNGAVSRSGITR